MKNYSHNGESKANMTHTREELKQKQSLPLSAKIVIAETRIKQWYDHYQGMVYVAFSGGKDSTVLLHIARKLYPNIPAVFVDTGLEYPEIRDFVAKFDNVEWIKPKLNFKAVLSKYGYPVVTKEVSEIVEEARRGYEKRLKQLDGTLYDKQGNLSPYNCPKWKFLLNAPFAISNKCCNIMKKNPAKDYEKRTGRVRITGQMACESRLRTSHWISHGCNSFDANRPVSNPLSVWTENDILKYIHDNNIEIASVYGDIVSDGMGKDLFDNDVSTYKTTGVDRTGCMFCIFGAHLEKYPNRFVRMSKTHPKIYDYCFKPVEVGGLGLAQVLDYIGVQYKESV